MERDLAEFEQLDELEQLRTALTKSQLQLKRSKAKTADLIEAVHLGAREAAIAVGAPSAPPAPKERRTKRAEAALLLLSDWHVGKETSSYNTKVAEKRIRLLGEKVAKIANIERADHPVRECHALIAGDLVENLGIFAGQAYEVDSSMFSQLFSAANMLHGLLLELCATFDVVHVWTQTGNHGRIGRKGDNPRADNIDAVLYQVVRERVGHLNVEWHPMSSWFTRVEIGSYAALMVHGDQIKSFGGNIPAFGIARKTNAWASGVLGVDFVDVMMGHFHQPLVVPLANGRGRTFVNPSIESDSAYAQEFMAATGTPAQRLFFVDPTKGRLTSERLLWLD